MATALTGAHLNERVYDELRARVLRRQHAPGSKLSLHTLATELGVSRSPVHHALTRLVAEGLLWSPPCSRPRCRCEFHVWVEDRAR